MNGVSVVVPTKDSNDTVPTLFASLDRARAALDAPSEVIVVDDSGPAQRDELKRLCARHGVTLLSGGPNVGGKRNVGAAAARHDVLLFVDSDCHASPELLREHWRAHAAGSGACAGPVEFEGPRSWLWPGMDLLGTPAAFRAPAARRRVPWAPTANLSVSRSCFEAAGGFDDTLPHRGGGEDVDLCFRLADRGVPVDCAAGALVRHSTSTWNSPGVMLRRLARYGRSEPRLLERHRARSLVAPPGHLTLLAPSAAVWLAAGLLGGEGAWWLAPLWAAAYVAAWLTRALRPGRPDPRVVSAVAVSLLLEAAFEAGRVTACLRQRRPAWLLRRLLMDERQVTAEWTGGSARMWCWCAASAVCAAAWAAAAGGR